MNWYLLNLPLCAAFATGVVAPIMVVISRECMEHDNAPLAHAAGSALVPAPVFGTSAGPACPRERELQFAS
jgi:hypothetical protein